MRAFNEGIEAKKSAIVETQDEIARMLSQSSKADTSS